jgi:hypothetical protein
MRRRPRGRLQCLRRTCGETEDVGHLGNVAVRSWRPPLASLLWSNWSCLLSVHRTLPQYRHFLTIESPSP